VVASETISNLQHAMLKHDIVVVSNAENAGR